MKLAAMLAMAAMSPPGALGPPGITSKAIYVMEAETGRMVYGWNKDVRRYPASTTKIMTGLLLLEHGLPTDVITVSPRATEEKGSSLHLKAGELLRRDDLAAGLMLRSANDACVAAAEHVAGSVAAFSDLMNERAAKIGCQNTHFRNPNGMHETGHYSSARDLAWMGREAMKNADFRRIVGIPKLEISRSLNTKDTLIENRNILLGKDPRVKGIKTGWTNPAGRCFVGWVESGGKTLVTSILGCNPSWEPDQKRLMNWIDQKYATVKIGQKGSVFPEVSVDGSPFQKAKPRLDQDISAVIPVDAARPTLTFVPNPNLKAPIKAGEVIGEFRCKIAGQEDIVAPAVADQEVAGLSFASLGPWGMAMAVILGACWWVTQRKAKVMKGEWA